jgi:nitroreductase
MMPPKSDESVFDVIHTCRAMRRYTAEDVPDAIVHELLDAAIRAPSGGNAQNWRFIVVRDPDVKRRLGAEIRKRTRWKVTVDELRIAAARDAGILPPDDEARARRGLGAFKRLGERFEEIPVLICVCIEPDASTGKAVASPASIRRAVKEFGLLGVLRFAMSGTRIAEQGMWAAGYPAVQNILLAARAKGLGALLTAPQLLGPPGRVERILGLPRNVKLAAIIPVGHPQGRFGPVRRRPVEEFVFRDQYGVTGTASKN